MGMNQKYTFELFYHPQVVFSENIFHKFHRSDNIS